MSFEPSGRASSLTRVTTPAPEQFDLALDLDSSEATVEVQPLSRPRPERPPPRTARGDFARLLVGLAGIARRRVTVLRVDVPKHERQRRALAAGVLLVVLVSLVTAGGGGGETAQPKKAVATAPAAVPEPSATPGPAALALEPGAVLHSGDRGPQVRTLQEALAALGLFRPKPDGVFGKKTTRGVKAFQKQAGLEPDGVIGPQTAKALNRALAGLP